MWFGICANDILLYRVKLGVLLPRSRDRSNEVGGYLVSKNCMFQKWLWSEETITDLILRTRVMLNVDFGKYISKITFHIPNWESLFFFCIFQTAWKNDPRTRFFFPNFHSTVISTASQSPICPCFTIHKVHMFNELCDVEEKYVLIDSTRKLCIYIYISLSPKYCLSKMDDLHLFIASGWKAWRLGASRHLWAALPCSAYVRDVPKVVLLRCPQKTKGLEIHHVTFLFVFVGTRCL